MHYSVPTQNFNSGFSYPLILKLEGMKYDFLRRHKTIIRTFMKVCCDLNIIEKYILYM